MIVSPARRTGGLDSVLKLPEYGVEDPVGTCIYGLPGLGQSRAFFVPVAHDQTLDYWLVDWAVQHL